MEEKDFNASLYSIKDVKTQKFGNPFVASNDDEAKRIFNDLVLGSQDSLIAQHPTDFDLYYCCGWCSREGITSVDLPVLLMNANDVVSEYKRKISSQLSKDNKLVETSSEN